ncbi:hypothetical protein PPGU16_81790 (plasmid) [Paraburkholderia largidicola]|uniref:Uncharacterized protein n=1 Tax=Paraburkholderia largidicola TaxID=3014751 RepID=A0A7I8C249_9BURK|nr:hypothetical protein PPGU16_81790 [Paraburkholderia sp. PGU16]
MDLDGVSGEAELRMLYCADFPLRDLAACRPEVPAMLVFARQAGGACPQASALADTPQHNPPARQLVRSLRGGTASRRGTNTLAYLLALFRRRQPRWRTAALRFDPKGAQRIMGCRCMPRRSASCRLL